MWCVKVTTKECYEDKGFTWEYGAYRTHAKAKNIADEIKKYKYINPLYKIEEATWLGNNVEIIVNVEIEYCHLNATPFISDMFCNEDGLPPHTIDCGEVNLNKDFVDEYNKTYKGE